MDAKSHWLHLFGFPPLCVFKCFLKSLLEWVQSHIGRICLTFLHGVFSNVSSKTLDHSMHIRNGCICETFLHYMFSNVSSNHLSARMQNHAGCICLAFLHCGFSNVSSNRLLEWMQSRIGRICLALRNCVSLGQCRHI